MAGESALPRRAPHCAPHWVEGVLRDLQGLTYLLLPGPALGFEGAERPVGPYFLRRTPFPLSVV